MNFLEVLSIIVFCGIGASILTLSVIAFLRAFSETKSKYSRTLYWRIFDITKLLLIIFVIFQLVYQSYLRSK